MLEEITERLEDANVLVTGGSSETGPFVCRAFAEAGANVALTYHENQTGAEKTAEQVRDLGRRAETYQFDLLDQAQIEDLTHEVRNDWDHLDAVVLVTGSVGLRNFRDLSRQQLDVAIDGNVKGNLMLAKNLGYWMKDGPDSLGRVIQFSAQSADNPSHSAYGIAKRAQAGMADFLAWQLAPEVTVNTIQPIGIDQDPDSEQPDEDPAPLGRKVHARQCARMCLLLCDPAFDCVTGQVIHMESGRNADSAYAEQL
jgi:NAD(P)-dependent dehydrogenase (short-subunit alcohol dehydrogenase family)